MRRRRPAAAAILALAVAALSAVPAAAQSVQVYSDGHGPMTQVLGQGTTAQFWVKTAGEAAQQDQHVNAYYFKDVLDGLGIQANALDVVGGGQPFGYTLGSAAEIEGSANYKSVEPFLWLEDVAKSIRPMRDENDVNAGDIVFGDPLYLFAHSNGSIPFTFSYTVHGTTVDFTPSRSDCSVRWFYGDPQTTSDAAGTFTYPTTSQYVAIADAECADGGAASVKLVNVGAGPAPTPGPDPTATAAATASPRPTRTPRPRATATATATPRKGGGGSKSGGSGSGSPSATATATASATAAAIATAAAQPTATPTATPASPGKKTPKKVAPAPARSDLPVVQGRLISAIVPVSPASLAPAAAPPATSAAGGGSPPGRFAIPFGLLALAALLVAGAWRERRGL